MELEEIEYQYAGFWVRTGASLIDFLLTCVIVFPILIGIYGSEYFTSDDIVAGSWDFLLSWVLPAIGTIMFWMYKSATPGKMAIRAKIVDANTGEKASTGQLIGRYFAYILSILPLLLGCIWVAWDRKKQGWHDKLSGTVVIRSVRPKNKPVVFNK